MKTSKKLIDLFIDTVYLLAFAIIMLATDLHSHAIKEKDKMRKEIWIPMQLVNFKNQVDKQLLSDVFDRIAAQKLTVQGEDDEASVDTNGMYPRNTPYSIFSRNKPFFFNIFFIFLDIFFVYFDIFISLIFSYFSLFSFFS